MKDGWYYCWIREHKMVRFIRDSVAYYYNIWEQYPTNRPEEVIEKACCGPISQYSTVFLLMEVNPEDYA